MPVESASYISQLNPSYPAGTEAKSQGDNHLRLLKTVMQTQFPSLGTTPVTVTAAEINFTVQNAGKLAVGNTTTTLTLSAGIKNFTVQTGRAFGAGQLVKITDQADSTRSMIGTVASYDTTTGAMSVNADRISGSGSGSDWFVTQTFDLAASLNYLAVTTTATVVLANKSTLIDASGTFTLSFDGAALLGAGWWCYVRNSGTGDITLDPSGAETIDGLATYVMYPGETRLIVSDGITLRSVVVHPFAKTFTASGTFVKPPGYSFFDSLTWSGGNSGQKTGSTTTAMGGGGGGCFPARIPASALSASTSITVGAGGAARTTVNTGALGGDSSIGSLIVVKQHATYTNGGAVQLGSVSAVSAGDVSGVAADFGGLASVTGHSLYGGTPSVDSGTTYTSMYGAGSGGVYSSGGFARPPGTSKFGGAGGAAGDAVSGTDGTAPGGGGGGTRTGTQSGAGARGEVRIWGVA